MLLYSYTPYGDGDDFADAPPVDVEEGGTPVSTEEAWAFCDAAFGELMFGGGGLGTASSTPTPTNWERIVRRSLPKSTLRLTVTLAPAGGFAE